MSEKRPADQPEEKKNVENREKKTEGRRRGRDDDSRSSEWTPKTRLGRLVKQGIITNLSEALQSGLPLREPEIVDILLPDLEDEVLDVNMVQRMTDSGRRVKFAITAVVGNKDGFVGLGQAKGKEVGPAIRKAIDNAKLNIMEVRRGCGSWECSCRTPHTVPFQVSGKTASAEIVVKPAPRGIGVAASKIGRHVLMLAGIKDAWTFTKGETRTTVNFAQACMAALRATVNTRVTPTLRDRLKIHQGPVGGMIEGRRDRAYEAPAAESGGEPDAETPTPGEATVEAAE